MSPDARPLYYALAAAAEISGCFAFWAWLRLGKSALWIVPGVAALVLFARALTRIDATYPGRAFAAYCGVYIAAPLAWMWVFERNTPDRWNMVGVGVCLPGSAIIPFRPIAT